jgi:hypothetical protein
MASLKKFQSFLIEAKRNNLAIELSRLDGGLKVFYREDGAVFIVLPRGGSYGK